MASVLGACHHGKAEPQRSPPRPLGREESVGCHGLRREELSRMCVALRAGSAQTNRPTPPKASWSAPCRGPRWARLAGVHDQLRRARPQPGPHPASRGEMSCDCCLQGLTPVSAPPPARRVPCSTWPDGLADRALQPELLRWWRRSFTSPGAGPLLRRLVPAGVSSRAIRPLTRSRGSGWAGRSRVSAW